MALFPRPSMYRSWGEWGDRLVEILSTPVAVDANTVIRIPYFGSENLPKASLPGGLIYLADGGVVAPIFSDGTNWRRIADNSIVTTDLVKSVSSSPYTMAASEFILAVDASGGSRLINLPAAATALPRPYYIKKIDTSGNAMTVDGDGAETIDGEPTIVMDTPYATLMIFSDYTNWYIL